MKIIYAPTFVRKYKRLPPELREEAKEKISLFTEDPNHPFLKLHKLKGNLKNRWSFSINYQYRIVCRYTQNGDVEFLTIGDHDIYR
ncbi:MAG: type II toxin-antitoxin system mRNA interferase toxin, RelE/StbE family [Candidatus Magasanikbacteria bacterium CG_4_9_14_0_2_um_filter_42_11]|uniref:Type II toxin-antitoxin system mRNA interferase toxin, RelE/StbE family n=1 Tax=Candidatus Magasanikbacteria bacterium CG_4_9_14_0_2_um_filter_42_11 TaxID=1974643 RepID=A0A2M8FAY6_9BACT|nr:MAG: type II toxin-antitoxin system mRNA interferase toxin, RelE/StbE family [Candidatus Magasanikbacteria bacterium CG10_big_fil_rev_8_21_14_0_10_43_9]PIY92700.1 MAG: type II toxin-antitoxin system mRNA interferase toxin, RelE/StbE family [Candidatus Magasanikbacteria bacterium CG_4_10_14_0_8_um_filter_42_12]PJC52839.1 MAG: type II toxin-antitoxin system mRNA interferase toxin, RelE/StbE family [Candidatus Magasanikbacteria bacterium CG_4_9_14_0_2_um_filter_42_11]